VRLEQLVGLISVRSLRTRLSRLATELLGSLALYALSCSEMAVQRERAARSPLEEGLVRPPRSFITGWA